MPGPVIAFSNIDNPQSSGIRHPESNAFINVIFQIQHFTIFYCLLCAISFSIFWLFVFRFSFISVCLFISRCFTKQHFGKRRILEFERQHISKIVIKWRLSPQHIIIYCHLLYTLRVKLFRLISVLLLECRIFIFFAFCILFMIIIYAWLIIIISRAQLYQFIFHPLLLLCKEPIHKISGLCFSGSRNVVAGLVNRVSVQYSCLTGCWLLITWRFL